MGLVEKMKASVPNQANPVMSSATNLVGDAWGLIDSCKKPPSLDGLVTATHRPQGIETYREPLLCLHHLRQRSIRRARKPPATTKFLFVECARLIRIRG